MNDETLFDIFTRQYILGYDEELVSGNEENNRHELENDVTNSFISTKNVSIQKAHSTQDPKKKNPIFSIIKEPKELKEKTKGLSLEGCLIPKEKHLNVERKKNRIQFQQNHKKTIYSYCHLTPPLDFKELFGLVREHQQNTKSGKGKSFHFYRNKSGKVQILTFPEKQELRNGEKQKNGKKRRL